MRLARTLGIAGRTCIWLGALILLFVAYQLWGTGLAHSRAQSSLEKNFQSQLDSAPSGGGEVSPQGTGAATAEPVTTTTPPPPPDDGEAMAHLVIPRIGVDQYVVSGVSRSDLQKGPGHYPNTPMPGQEGNSAIAGHRTTYGQPFHDVDRLDPGDEILITTLQGSFHYEVMDTEIVSPSDVHVLDDFGDNRLTLTSCHPKFSAAQRIIVTAELVDAPAPAAVQRVAAPTTSIDGNDRGPWAPVLLWGLLALSVWIAFYLLSRYWRKWPSYALGSAPFALVLFMFYVHVGNLLPAAY